MKPRGNILTLTTDYGTKDGYAGAIKGALLTQSPTVSIHDISHEIPPQDIWEGAWCLRRAVPRFPPGSTHLVVVDPGVGTERPGVVIETENYLLIGPDNGVLTLAAKDDGIRRIFEIDEGSGLWHRSHTFDGLTFFAGVAGHLLSGLALEEVGQEAEDLIELNEQKAKLRGNIIDGVVMLFDHFGNAITDIPGYLLDGRQVETISLMETYEVRPCRNYGELAGTTSIGALVNSDGYLELALYGASLRERHQLQTGESVRIQIRTA